MLEQCLQEVYDLRTLYRPLIEPEVETIESDPGDGCERVPIEVVLQNRSLAAR